MTPPIPSADIQEQYAIVFILLFFACLIAIAFYRMWRELMKWITDQDTKRESEREKQRDWQAEQDKVRDERWQTFLEKLQSEWIKQDGQRSDTLKGLAGKIDELIREVRDHDIRTRIKHE